MVESEAKELSEEVMLGAVVFGHQQQQAVIDTLAFKCEVLWCMLDALHCAYVTPGLIPPGAVVPRNADA